MNLRSHILLLVAMLPGLAQAEGGPKYGLDRMLSKAAPRLANRMKEAKADGVAAPEKDMNMGYPNYRYRGPVAEAKARLLANAVSNANTYNPINRAAVASNPLAVRQAAVAPVAPAAAVAPKPNFVDNSPNTSSASALVAEANEMENRIVRRQQQQEQAELNWRTQRNAQQAPETFNRNSPASNRLLASLQRAPSENIYRAQAVRQAQSDAQYLAQQRAMRGRVAASEELYPVAAQGEADTGVSVSRAIRGNTQQIAPVQLQKYQVFVSDGYINRHSEKSRQNSSEEPGGVYHVGTKHAATMPNSEGTLTSGAVNPFNNSARRNPQTQNDSLNESAVDNSYAPYRR